MSNTSLKGNLEGKLRELNRYGNQCLETEVEFSRLTEQVLSHSHSGTLYSLLGVAAIKRHFERVQRKEEDIKLQALRQQPRFKDILRVDHSFQFDGHPYSLDNSRQINALLDSLNTGLTYVLEKDGAFVGKIGDKKVDGIAYKEVDEICVLGHFQTGACYVSKTGNAVREGEIYVFKNSSREYKEALGRYAFASWRDRTSRELLRKYYGIKNIEQFSSSRKIDEDLTLLTLYHELGHHYSIDYLRKNIGNSADSWDIGFIRELAADYFGEYSSIGMINSLARKKFRSARRLLALTTVEQNERPKMKYERERYGKAFITAIPYLTKILDSRNFSGELSRFVRAQREYIREVIEHAGTIPRPGGKSDYICKRSVTYNSDFKRIYDNIKPEPRNGFSFMSIF